MTDVPALLLAADSRGGAALMITLAEALRGRGANARIAAYSDFGDRLPLLLHSIAHSRRKRWEDRHPSRFTCSRW